MLSRGRWGNGLGTIIGDFIYIGATIEIHSPFATKNQTELDVGGVQGFHDVAVAVRI